MVGVRGADALSREGVKRPRTAESRSRVRGRWQDATEYLDMLVVVAANGPAEDCSRVFSVGR